MLGGAHALLEARQGASGGTGASTHKHVVMSGLAWPASGPVSCRLISCIMLQHPPGP